jgi:tetratricopeptide (TPR) repeat protein
MSALVFEAVTLWMLAVLLALGCSPRVRWNRIALAAQNRIEEFITRSRQARKFSAIEYQIRQTWVWSLTAEAFGKAGRFPVALSLLDEASRLMEANEERFIESEIYRIRGELVLNQVKEGLPSADQAREAEAAFVKAIEIARARSAKMLALRAVISLSDLLKQTGKVTEAAIIRAVVS